jgi:pilus assembly protein CpaF
MSEVRMYLTPRERPADQAEVRVTSSLSEQARRLLKIDLHQELLKRMDLEKLSMIQEDLSGGRQRLQGIILQLVGEQQIPLSAADRDQVAGEVLDEVLGLGPLEPFLKDPTVNDILVNTFETVYIERRGVLEKTNVSFRDNAHLMHIIDKIVSAVGRRIDESSPMVDARLLDGSRVNIVIPPLAVDGPIVSIRRFSATPLVADDLLRHRTLIPQMLEVLKGAVRARLNIVVSGGTGAGKTTLLNVLSGYISPAERIITIEDSAELQIKQAHVVRLECRPPNLERRGAIRQRELVINALRMRPDRIIIGEVRGDETLDMLQSMNTGHDGSLTTVHANTPRDAIARLETMVLMGAVTLPEKAIRSQIASAIDLIVQVSRMSDGSRRVTHITEITGMSGDIVSLQDIFVFERQGLGLNGKVNGRFLATGIVPKFADKLAAAGFPLSLNLMDQSVEV